MAAALEYDYRISGARYAKDAMAVDCPSQDGWKTRAGRLAEVVARGRWSNREKAYVMSRRAVERFERLFRAGWDASVVVRHLEAPSELLQAVVDAETGRLYADNAGNFRLRRDDRECGPIAPYNRAVKSWQARTGEEFFLFLASVVRPGNREV